MPLSPKVWPIGSTSLSLGQEPSSKMDQGWANAIYMPLQVYCMWKQAQLDQMQAQEFEPKSDNEHTNSTKFFFFW